MRRLASTATLAFCGAVHAQAVLEPTVTNPGARSLGLAGAFVALADDATAAFTNPAGLTQLIRREASAEVSTRSDRTDRPGADLSGTVFGSYVRPRGRWSLALYGHTLANLDFPGEAGAVPGELPLLADLAVVNLGLSTGLRITDSVSLGLGLACLIGLHSRFAVDLEPFQSVVMRRTSSVRPGLIAGLLWNLDDAWTMGLAHRTGAEFHLEGRDATGSVVAVVPDVSAIGLRWRSPAGAVSLASEIERVDGVGDRTRVHLGAEWLLLSSRPLVGLRAGLWHDPGIGSRATDLGGLVPAGGVTHGTAGIGLGFAKVQLNLGLDSSSEVTTVSLSAIFPLEAASGR